MGAFKSVQGMRMTRYMQRALRADATPTETAADSAAIPLQHQLLPQISTSPASFSMPSPAVLVQPPHDEAMTRTFSCSHDGACCWTCSAEIEAQPPSHICGPALFFLNSTSY